MASRERYQRLAYRAMADISGTILVPAIAAVFVSNWLKLGQAATIGVLALVFLMTAVVLVKKIRSYGKAYRELVDTEHHGNGAARS